MELNECYIPQRLQKSCDVLLKLDDGNKLPAHSLFLAHSMTEFCKMLGNDGPLARASQENVVTIPFSGCSLLEARQFLSAIYYNYTSTDDTSGSCPVNKDRLC